MKDHDFIVVGGGPAGCSLAVQLAESPRRPRVLLLELGGKNDGSSMRAPATRWVHHTDPQLNPFYKTVPQANLKNRVINYDRGIGLGGSSAVNFCVYDIGPKDDFEEIARIVDDDDWHWENILPKYKALEHFHGESIPDKTRPFANPLPENHGKNGKLHIGYSEEWDDVSLYYTGLFQKAGYKMNPDLNSGDPIGVGYPAHTFHKGWRTMASDMLMHAPENLTINTHSAVERVIFNEKVATGVQVGEKQYNAVKEIFLCAGALDTPKILMHSGIGPAAQLEKFGIAVLYDSPYIGQGLRDHFHCPLVLQRQEHTTKVPAFWRDPTNLANAQVQWDKDRTGSLSSLGCNFPLAFLKSEELYQSQEFQSLPEHEKTHLLQSTVPSYELGINVPYEGHFTDPLNAVAVVLVFVFCLNLQSRGSVTLQSSDFSAPLLYNPCAFSHPFDRRVAIEGIRTTMKTMLSAPFSDDTVRPINLPKSFSDEDIFEHVQDNALSTWHMAGTVKMGGEEDETACVDKEFRVRGVERLRVVDMSVFPILPK
ncbi:MAG: hypothetical protein Q9227_001008 [Pyrenula ochraceoflavens]